MEKSFMLKTELDRIFERIDYLTESISLNDRRMMKQGFEDGIYQILEKKGWFGRMVGSIGGNISGALKSAYKSTSDKVSSWYDKGKEMAGKAWGSISKFFNGLWNTITEGFQSLTKKLQDGWDACVTYLKGVYDRVANELNAAWTEMKEKSEALSQAIVGWFYELPARISESVGKMKDKIVSMGKGLQEWWGQQMKAFKKQSDNLKNSSVSGLNTIGKYMTGAASWVWENLKTGTKVTGQVALAIGFVLFGAIIDGSQFILKTVKAIPGVAKQTYENCAKAMSDFCEKYIGDFGDVKDAFIQAEKSWMKPQSKSDVQVGGEDRVKSKYKELLDEWKLNQKKSGKNTSAGQGTRNRLMKQAAELVGESRIVKTFESFVHRYY